MQVTFHGVRGSTPSPCDANRRYGGNTSSVSVDVGAPCPILLDLGTGVRQYGLQVDGPFVGAVLVTHLHWDHVQGLPFFGGLLHPDADVVVYGPRQPSGTLLEAIEAFIRPPYFPVSIDQLPCTFRAVGVEDDTFAVGDATVTSRVVPHVGETVGYRIEAHGRSVAYISDHQQPENPTTIAAGVLDLCRDADLVIHDAQYTPDEFATKRDWGHCTIDYAIHVAATSGAKRLALFHHDPAHGDDQLDRLVAEATTCAARLGVDVVGAREGLTLDV